MDEQVERQIEFLNARLDEDGWRAEALRHFTVPEQPYYSCAGSRTEPYGDLEWGEGHCDCFLAERKARKLREVAAKRAIIARCTESISNQGIWMEDGQAQLAEDTIEILTTIYSDHPGYDPAWATVSPSLSPAQPGQAPPPE